MKNTHVVALVKHSNAEILDHISVRGYYDPNDYDNVPHISELQYHRRVKILDRVTENSNDYYIGVEQNGDVYRFSADRIVSLDKRANNLDTLLNKKEKAEN
jgi:viroplasmin and RNaseH domain-containing protein